ncbi:hypothetical protein [Microvirga flavescens]|uniref:hypothetical protein n=1 Tax=Microvirga flavescens TaxID=2249811 RepID=UPI000DD5EB1B|nr:hypothetical protein [Microvirga flavescens]
MDETKQETALTYTHNPRPFSSPVSFSLKGDRLTVDSGRKVSEVRLDAVEAVRLSFEPGRFGQKAFKTTVRMTDGKTFRFSSLSWRSLVESEQLTREYRAFAQGLCGAIATASPKARFIAGRPYPLWAANAALAGLCLVAMAILVWRALQNNATGLALLGVLFAGICIWQLEPMIRLNRPRPFEAGTLPSELLPPET